MVEEEAVAKVGGGHASAFAVVEREWWNNTYSVPPKGTKISKFTNLTA